MLVYNFITWYHWFQGHKVWKTAEKGQKMTKSAVAWKHYSDHGKKISEERRFCINSKCKICAWVEIFWQPNSKSECEKECMYCSTVHDRFWVHATFFQDFFRLVDQGFKSREKFISKGAKYFQNWLGPISCYNDGHSLFIFLAINGRYCSLHIDQLQFTQNNFGTQFKKKSCLQYVY